MDALQVGCVLVVLTTIAGAMTVLWWWIYFVELLDHCCLVLRPGSVVKEQGRKGARNQHVSS